MQNLKEIIMAKRKKNLKEEIKEGLRQLAFGDVKDCIYLLLSSEEDILANLSGLKLMNISEIKRPKGGGMEIKFFDRIKALEKLDETEHESADEPLSFYSALQQGAQNINKVFEEQESEQP